MLVSGSGAVRYLSAGGARTSLFPSFVSASLWAYTSLFSLPKNQLFLLLRKQPLETIKQQLAIYWPTPFQKAGAPSNFKTLGKGSDWPSMITCPAGPIATAAGWRDPPQPPIPGLFLTLTFYIELPNTRKPGLERKSCCCPPKIRKREKHSWEIWFTER